MSGRYDTFNSDSSDEENDNNSEDDVDNILDSQHNPEEMDGVAIAEELHFDRFVFI